jgi:hypothetical protein
MIFVITRFCVVFILFIFVVVFVVTGIYSIIVYSVIVSGFQKYEHIILYICICIMYIDK